MNTLPRSLKKVKKEIEEKASAFVAICTPKKRAKKRMTFQLSDIDSVLDHISEGDLSLIPSSSSSNIDESQSDIGSIKSDLHPIGLHHFPAQMIRMLNRNPPKFNLMIAGRGGLGKSTLINTLFRSEIFACPLDLPRPNCTNSLQITPFQTEEHGFRVNYSVIETPGFGNVDLDRSLSLEPILGFIDEQYQKYFLSEIAVQRKAIIPDTLVHACLYLVSNTLTELDLFALSQLSTKVNLIPVIAKADSYTQEELHEVKALINAQLSENNIKTYPIPSSVKAMLANTPFAVVGSNAVAKVNGSLMRVRKYHWGMVEVDNVDHCDTKILRDFLICHSFFDLINSTHSELYEDFRSDTLTTGTTITQL